MTDQNRKVVTREKLFEQATNYLSAPGQLTAYPGTDAGSLNAFVYTRGTSNAAALTSRAAAQIYDDVIGDISERLGAGRGLSRSHEVLLIKALFVHGASWGDKIDFLESSLKNERNSQRLREYAARFLGYGQPDFSRIFHATDQRATFLGWGDLEPVYEEIEARIRPMVPVRPKQAR